MRRITNLTRWLTRHGYIRTVEQIDTARWRTQQPRTHRVEREQATERTGTDYILNLPDKPDQDIIS